MCHNLPRIGYKMPYNKVYTKENTMLEEFVNYVDSFYGQNDPLYPMMSRETKQPLTKFDIQRATKNYLSMCSDCLLYTSDAADE